MPKYLWLLVAILWATLIYRLTITPQLILTDNSLLQALFMASAHFFVFGLLAVFLYLAIPHFFLPHASSLVLSSLYGLAIELIQSGIPNRTADPIDWLLDTLGAIALLYIYAKFSNLKFSNSQI